jgi:calcineurin-like phosphoesterase family protein
MADPVRNAFLVLSDLHFGVDFLREAEIDPLQTPRLLKYLAPKVRHFFEVRCKAHDMGILLVLPSYLKKVLRSLRQQGFERATFDLALLLGYLATYANGSSYTFLREFLTEDLFKDSSGKHRKGIGGLHNGDVVVIPGNHDKLLRKNLDLYHDKFCSSLGIDHQPTPQSSFFTSRTMNGEEFLFVLIEASNFAPEDSKLDFGALAHLASGRISAQLRREVLGKFQTIKKAGIVDKAHVRDFSKARKILVVHYAVDDRVVLGPTPLPQELVVSHHCDGLDSFVEELADNLHFVLHGHLHRARIYNHCGVPIISATTTTQVDGENGFFVIKFLASGDIVPEHHKWNSNGFTLDDSTDLKARITRSRDPIVKTTSA